MAKRLGAVNVDEVDAVEFVRDITNGELADVVFDCSRASEAMESSMHMVRH